MPFFVFQQDPGVKGYRYYTITDNFNNNIGQVLVPKTTQGTYSAGTEYWFDVVVLADSTRTLTFSWQDYEWTDPPPTLGTQSFTMPQAPGWSAGEMPATSPSNFVDNVANLVIGWQLTYDSGTRLWGGSLVWDNQTGLNDAFAGPAPGSATLSGNTTPTLRSGWFTTTVDPINPS